MDKDTPPEEDMEKEIFSDGANKLFCGDNLQIMHQLSSNSIDLIYLDPPYNSGRNYKEFDDRWSWGPEPETPFAKALIEIVGRGSLGAYLIMMLPRLIELHRVLKSTGSLYLHCDPAASHYLKIVLDSIFGAGNLRNEIIWHYNSGARGGKDFGRRHDTIFRYSASSSYQFNADSARVPYSKNINVPKSKAKYYHPLGKVVGDVWKINIIAQNDKTERLGYPTQKPEALLERIIEASSNPGDIVLDPFCGCGTTVAVAQRLGRRWIGIDINEEAYRLSKNRIVGIGKPLFVI